MKSCLTLAVCAVLLLSCGLAEARIAPLRVVMISGSGEYESDKTLPILKTYLENKYPSIVTILSAKGHELPGLDALDRCDVVVLFTRRLKLQDDQLARIKKYCTSGKPLVGIRTASHGVETWLDLDREVLGGNYKGHYSSGPICEVKFVPSPKLNPIRIVHDQDSNRGAPGGCPPNQAEIGHFKVIDPVLLPRMKERHNGLGIRVDSREVRAFVKVAVLA